MKIIYLATLFLFIVSCKENYDLKLIKSDLQDWAESAEWKETEFFSNSIMTERGWVIVSTSTIILKKDGSHTCQAPVLDKGQFMVAPSMKVVSGVNDLISEAIRCYKEEKLIPIVFDGR